MLSRVADNLYWMNRYMERAEHTARLLEVNLTLMLDQTPEAVGRRWERVLRSLHLPVPEGGVSDAFEVAQQLTFDLSNQVSILYCIRAARENARQVREQISSEMWEHLNRLYLQVQGARPLSATSPTSSSSPPKVENGAARSSTSPSSTSSTLWRQPDELLSAVRQGAHLVQGATDATMRHGEGWYFIQVGRDIERASKTAALLNVYFTAEEPRESSGLQAGESLTGEYLKWVALLKSCSAFEAYCKVYSAELRRERIGEFLLLDAEFPRSVRFAADRIETALAAIADATGQDAEGQRMARRNSAAGDAPPVARLHRLAGQLSATLDFSQIDEILAEGLPAYLKYVQHQCVQIHHAIYQAYIGYVVES